MAILTFGDEVKTACDFTADKAQLTRTLQALQPSDQQTHLHAAILRANSPK